MNSNQNDTKNINNTKRILYNNYKYELNTKKLYSILKRLGYTHSIQEIQSLNEKQTTKLLKEYKIFDEHFIKNLERV